MRGLSVYQSCLLIHAVDTVLNSDSVLVLVNHLKMSFSSSLLYTLSSPTSPAGYLSYDAQSSPYNNLTFTSDRSAALQLVFKTAPKDYEYNICLPSGGLCIDIFFEDKTQPRLAPAGYYSGQQWTVDEVSGGAYELENEYSGSGYALSWSGGNAIMEPSGGGNGRWKIEVSGFPFLLMNEDTRYSCIGPPWSPRC